MKAKTDMTAELVMKAFEDHQPKSLSQLAHNLGYKGSVSSNLTKKFRTLIPNIADLLNSGDHQETSPKSVKPSKPVAATVAKNAAKVAKTVKAKPVIAGKWPHDPRNPFRAGSYGTCFDILAAPAHKNGLPKEKLVALLAEATGKDVPHAAFDAQVVLSARGNDEQPGLSRNDGPRNRSCRPGFWIKRTNGHVQLMVD